MKLPFYVCYKNNRLKIQTSNREDIFMGVKWKNKPIQNKFINEFINDVYALNFIKIYAYLSESS